MEQTKNCSNCAHYEDGLEFCDTCTCTSKGGHISGPTNWSPKPKDRPTICTILGVDVGERFAIYGMDTIFWISQDGTFCTDPPNVAGSSRALLYALENPALIRRIPVFGADELAFCRQLYTSGARWLARGKHLRWYSKKPFLREEDDKWDMRGDWGQHSGKLPYGLFPSLKQQQSVSLEEILKKQSEL